MLPSTTPGLAFDTRFALACNASAMSLKRDSHPYRQIKPGRPRHVAISLAFTYSLLAACSVAVSPTCHDLRCRFVLPLYGAVSSASANHLLQPVIARNNYPATTTSSACLHHA